MNGLVSAARFVVVGAGAIGCAIAYQLARRGATDVLVLERDTIGSGSSGRGAGGVRALFGLELEIRFSLIGRAFFEQLGRELGPAYGLRETGYLFLLTDESQVERFTREAELQRQLGVDVRLLDQIDLAQLVPGVRVDDVLAGAWGPRDGQANPRAVVSAMAERARALGVQFAERTAVRRLVTRGGRVISVETTRGAVEPGLVIDAAGPQAALVAATAGVRLPVEPRRRHIFVTAPFPGLRHPTPMVMDGGGGFYFRSEGQSVLMSPGDTGLVDDVEAEPEVDPEMLRRTRVLAAHRVPGVEHLWIENAWSGYRPLTPDGHAIIDWVPGVENMLCAVGFGGHGFQHAPAAGEMLADILLDGRPSLDLAPLRLSRFDSTTG